MSQSDIGLSRAVGAEEADDLTLGNVEVYPPHGLDRALSALERARQPTRLDDRHAMCLSLSSLWSFKYYLELEVK